MRTRYSPPPHLLLSVTFLPDDFPTRLGLFKEATGLSWNGLATCMGVDPRQIQRWRRGTKPNGDGLFALFLLLFQQPPASPAASTCCSDRSTRPSMRSTPASLALLAVVFQWLAGPPDPSPPNIFV